ncbi:MAG: TspO/MBR family protein [bacterium]
MKLSNFFKFIISIVVCQMAGIIGSIFTVSAIPNWYAALNKPMLNPPSWVFGPVWITLYFLMGVAMFMVWRNGLEKKEVRVGLIVFGVQLFLNALWSIVFFGLHSPGWAFVNIIALWFAIIFTMIIFYRISKPVVYLLAPYILWVSFACYLNYAILILN